MNTWKTDKYCCVDHPGYGTSWVKIVLSQNGLIIPKPVVVSPLPLSHPHVSPGVQLSTCCCLLCSNSQLRACLQSLSQSIQSCCLPLLPFPALCLPPKPLPEHPEPVCSFQSMEWALCARHIFPFFTLSNTRISVKPNLQSLRFHLIQALNEPFRDVAFRNSSWHP